MTVGAHFQEPNTEYSGAIYFLQCTMQQFAKVSDIGVSRIYENSLAWQYCNNEEYMGV